MRRKRSVSLRLAFSLLATEWSVESLDLTCQRFFGEDTDPAFVMLVDLVVPLVLENYSTPPLDRARELAEFIFSLLADLDQLAKADENHAPLEGAEQIISTEPSDLANPNSLCPDHADGSRREESSVAPENSIGTQVQLNQKQTLDDADHEFDESDEDEDEDEVDDDFDGEDPYLEQGVLEFPARGPFRMPIAPAQMLRNRWGVPIIHTVGELAEFLGISLNDLQWFADRRGMQVRATKEQLHHYTYRWIPKRDGSFRLLEQPKPRLKHLQRMILNGIVALIPVHGAAHGFVSGRSVLTAAVPHAAHRVLLRFDLQNFFGSVRAERVFGIFRTCGYPEAVAHALTGLVTNRVPNHVISQRRTSGEIVSAALRASHLPQGAPTSPAFANLAAIGIDRRMSGLAKTYDATYTRYADDLFVSGDRFLLARSKSFCALSDCIVSGEGFRIHPKKTAFMTNAGQQRMLGLVVNEHPAVTRTEFDSLRATLHNCIKTGPNLQHRDQTIDFRSQLLGRIGWISLSSPHRAAKLKALFEQINWT
jgi:RNA-directed DNA polymerase